VSEVCALPSSVVLVGCSSSSFLYDEVVGAASSKGFLVGYTCMLHIYVCVRQTLLYLAQCFAANFNFTNLLTYFSTDVETAHCDGLDHDPVSEMLKTKTLARPGGGNGYDSGLATQRIVVRVPAVPLSGINLRQDVQTHVSLSPNSSL